MKELDAAIFTEFAQAVENVAQGHDEFKSLEKFMRIGMPAELRQVATTLASLFQLFETREGHLKMAIEELKATRTELEELNAMLDARVRERTRALEEANQLLESLSTTDALTGISNRRNFDHSLQHEVARSIRYDTRLSLIMLDIDLFKNVNDTFGHVFGDEVLKSIGYLLKTRLRSNDICARYGGEEFVILLPETSSEAAFYVAEKLRKLIAGYDISQGGATTRVTVSLGVAQFDPARMPEERRLVECADQAMYEAKHQGRNRTVVYSEN